MTRLTQFMQQNVWNRQPHLRCGVFRKTALLIAMVLAVLMFAADAYSQWTNDLFLNSPVSVGVNTNKCVQRSLTTTNADGTDTTIAYSVKRSASDSDLFARNLDNAGLPGSEVQIGNDLSKSQCNPQAVRVQAGALIAFEEDDKIYVSYVSDSLLASTNPTTPAALLLSDSPSNSNLTVTRGAFAAQFGGTRLGAFLAWQDDTNNFIKAQGVYFDSHPNINATIIQCRNVNGSNPAPLVSAFSGLGKQENPDVVSDGKGGAYIAFDNLSAIHVLKITSETQQPVGCLSEWQTQVPITNSVHYPQNITPQIVAGGTGSSSGTDVVVVWLSGFQTFGYVLAQKLAAVDGSSMWASEVELNDPITTNNNCANQLSVTSGHSRGTVVVWQSDNHVSCSANSFSRTIRVQKVDQFGSKLWGPDGVDVGSNNTSTTNFGDRNPTIIRIDDNRLPCASEKGYMVMYYTKANPQAVEFSSFIFANFIDDALATSHWHKLLSFNASRKDDLTYVLNNSKQDLIYSWLDKRGGMSDVYTQCFNFDGQPCAGPLLANTGPNVACAPSTQSSSVNLNGLQHLALGNAVLDLNDSLLSIIDIGPSSLDGVQIDLQGALGFSVDMLSLGLNANAKEGAAIFFDMTARTDTDEGLSLGTLGLVKENQKLTMQTSFENSQQRPSLIEFYSNRELAAFKRATEAIQFSRWPSGIRYNNVDGHLVIELKWLSWTTVSGNSFEPIENIDMVRFVFESNRELTWLLSTFSLRAANIDELTIFNQSVTRGANSVAAPMQTEQNVPAFLNQHSGQSAWHPNNETMTNVEHLPGLLAPSSALLGSHKGADHNRSTHRSVGTIRFANEVKMPRTQVFGPGRMVSTLGDEHQLRARMH